MGSGMFWARGKACPRHVYRMAIAGIFLLLNAKGFCMESWTLIGFGLSSAATLGLAVIALAVTQLRR